MRCSEIIDLFLRRFFFLTGLQVLAAFLLSRFPSLEKSKSCSLTTVVYFRSFVRCMMRNTSNSDETLVRRGEAGWFLFRL